MKKLIFFVFSLMISFQILATEQADRPRRRQRPTCSDTVGGRFIEPREGRQGEWRGYRNTDEEDGERRVDDDIDGRGEDRGGDARDPGEF